MENLEKSNLCSLQGFVPLRKDPDERSEMISQVLFGETIEVLDDEGKWLYIKTLNDKYEAWADKKSFSLPLKNPIKTSQIAKQNTTLQDTILGHNVSIPTGSFIPELKNDSFEILGKAFKVSNISHFVKPGALTLEEIINEVISVPYIWGGRSGYGFDCSGLTQYLSRVLGKEIPRDSGEQAAIGSTLSFLNEVKSGDLAFFDDAEGLIHHVGMMLSPERIIHSSGLVRIDRIDQQGIYNQELGAYTHKLRVLKRII